VRKDAGLYCQALAEIGDRHALAVQSARVDEYGVNTVFHLPTGAVVKLFTASDTWEHEAAVMQCLHEQAPGTAPRLLHTGTAAGLPYVVMSRLPGRALVHVWDELPRDAAIAVREQLGAVLRRVHACALPATTWPAVVRENLPAGVTPSWTAYIQTRRERAVGRQREKNCPAVWLQTMPAFLDEVGVHQNSPARVGLLHGEVNADHVFVTKEVGKWRVTGLLDFQAAMPGDPEHELAQAAFHCCVGEPACLRALLRGYGFADRELSRDLQRRFMAHFLLFAWCPFQRYIVNPEFSAGIPPGDFGALAGRWFDFGLVYKVSPPRKSRTFEPSVFYRTEGFKSSSTRPKPGYIRDTLLYAGDEREVSIHLFPDIDRLRVWLDDEKRQRLAAVGFATAPGKHVAIFVSESDQAKIPDFKPTVYSFDAADFERTPSNEFVSRRPVTAVGVEEFTMPVVLERWKIQVIAVPDVHECEKRLRQAGIECAMQTNRQSDVTFRSRHLTDEEQNR
jgi:hygromycin-B 7''-O-kinase